MRRSIGLRLEARRAFSIFTCSAFMKEAANSLLKVLEEPPERTSIDSAHGESARTAADDSVAGTSLQAGCASCGGDRDIAGRERRPELKPAQRALAARLAEGAVGRASDHGSGGVSGQPKGCAYWCCGQRCVSRTTQSYFERRRPIGEARTGRRRRSTCCARLGALLEDLLLVIAGTPELIRNLDLESGTGTHGPGAHGRLDCSDVTGGCAGGAGNAAQSAALAFAGCDGGEPSGTLKITRCSHLQSSAERKATSPLLPGIFSE